VAVTLHRRPVCEGGKWARRAVARHGGCGKPAKTHSTEGRRRWRDSPRRFDDGRWRCSSMLGDLRGEDGKVRQAVGADERQWRRGRRGIPGRRRQRRVAQSGLNADAFKGAWRRASRRRVALGVLWPPTGGPGQRRQPLIGGPALI
jgi:hypothetical protein